MMSFHEHHRVMMTVTMKRRDPEDRPPYRV